MGQSIQCAQCIQWQLRCEFPEFGSKFPKSEWNFPFEPFPHNIREIEALMEMKEDYRRVRERKKDGNLLAYGKGKSGGRKGKLMDSEGKGDIRRKQSAINLNYSHLCLLIKERLQPLPASQTIPYRLRILL